MSSIKLEMEQYCIGCEEFKPDSSMTIDYYDSDKEVNVKVHCKRLERCRRIAKHITTPRAKKMKKLWETCDRGRGCIGRKTKKTEKVRK